MEGDSLNISFDRGQVILRIFSSEAYEKYKALQKTGNFEKNSEPLELPRGVVTPDGYFYNIKGKMSLKEILCGEENVSVKILDALLANLVDAFSKCELVGVDKHDIIYDYSSVFYQNFGGFSFIIMPGASSCPGLSTCRDLIKTVFLNLSDDSLSQLSLSNVRKLIEETDEENTEKISELREIISPYLEEKTLSDKIFNYIRSKKMPSLSKVKKEELTDKNLVVKIIGEEKLEGVELVKEIEKNKKESIRIGRDVSFSEIRILSLFAGRQHALLSIDNDGSVSVKALSKIVPVLNGKNINSEEVSVSFLKGFSLKIAKENV